MTDDMRPAVAKALMTIGAHMEHDSDEVELLAEILNDAYNAGANAARRWLPLTSDPSSWPEEGQFVCVTDALETWSGPNANSDAVWWNPHTNPTQGWTHWLPLPAPPKGESK